MGVVDLSDQIKVTYESDRRSIFRFYLRVFFDFLDIAVVNSKIVYNKIDFTRLSIQYCTNYDTEVFKQKKSCSAIQTIEEFKRSIIWHCGSFTSLYTLLSSLSLLFIKECLKSNLRTLYNMQHCTLSSKGPQLLSTIPYKTMIHSYISQVQFYLFVTSSYST